VGDEDQAGGGDAHPARHAVGRLVRGVGGGVAAHDEVRLALVGDLAAPGQGEERERDEDVQVVLHERVASATSEPGSHGM
jgi:hypothetical protein